MGDSVMNAWGKSSNVEDKIVSFYCVKFNAGEVDVI